MRLAIRYAVLLLMLVKCSECNIELNRQQLVKNLITFIQKNDENQLYNLLDTAYYNEVYSEGTLGETIYVINKNFEDCGFLVYDSLKIVTAGLTTEYILPLCREADKLASKLVVGFADFKKENKVLFFEVRTNIYEQDSATLKKLLLPADSSPQPGKQ